MKRQNVWFPDPIYNDLTKMAQEKDIKVPDAIRKAVEDAVDKWKKADGNK